MLGRRAGRPGLIGLAARTAVVAGTAQATSNAMNRRQQGKMAQQQAVAEQQQYEEQARIDAAAQQAVAQQAAAQQAAVQAAAAPAQAAAPAASAGSNLLEELQQLAQLQAAGVLTDEEFAAAKAKLLA